MHTGKTPYEYEGRDWGDASKNQRCQRLLKKKKQPEAWRDICNRLSLIATLLSDFQPPEL